MTDTERKKPTQAAILKMTSYLDNQHNDLYRRFKAVAADFGINEDGSDAFLDIYIDVTNRNIQHARVLKFKKHQREKEAAQRAEANKKASEEGTPDD